MHTELEIAVSGCGFVGGHFLNVVVTERCGDSTSNCRICLQHIKLDRKQSEGDTSKASATAFCNTRTFSPAIASYVTRLYRHTNTPCFRKLTGSNAFCPPKIDSAHQNYMQNSWSDFSSRDSSSLNSFGVCIRNSRLPYQGADL